MIYRSEQEAAQGLLLEVCAAMNFRELDYAVIGGWIPYLFHSSPIPHPGTFDVDILLNTTMKKEAVVAALDHLVSKQSFLRAPKNVFQLHKLLTVKDEQLVYHVDFLHRKYADDTGAATMQWGRYESIGTLGTDVVFRDKEIVPQALDGVLPTGQSCRVTIPFVSAAGFLSCKGRSIKSPKRTRDAFDIFLVIAQAQDRARLIAHCKKLMGDPIFSLSMANIKVHFDPEQDGLYNAADWLLRAEPASRNPRAVADIRKDVDPQLTAAKSTVAQVVNSFLDEVLAPW